MLRTAPLSSAPRLNVLMTTESVGSRNMDRTADDIQQRTCQGRNSFVLHNERVTVIRHDAVMADYIDSQYVKSADRVS